MFLCLWIATSAGRTAAPPAVDTISLLKKSVTLESLFLPPGHRTYMMSSYDRQGGDRDNEGYLRKEGDWFVIAEMQGPGAISRIWSENPSGLIRIYIDNGSSPLIQVDFRDLFSGKIKPFVEPFVYSSKSSPGSHWSYIPIPYSHFCKVAVMELDFYQIEAVAFPPEIQVKPFVFPFPSKEEKTLIALGKEFLGDDRPSEKNNSSREEYSISHSIAAGERIVLTTVEGPALVRGIHMQWQENKEEAGRDLLLRCYWDGEKEPSVIVPLHDFFGGGTQTFVLGKETNGWCYCYFPMPFQQIAVIEIENSSEQDVYTVDLLLSIQRNAVLPTSLRRFHAWWHRDNETPVRHANWNAARQEFLSRGDENFPAFSASGTGHLVGWGLQAAPFPESDVMLLSSSDPGAPSFPGTGEYGFFNLAGDLPVGNWPMNAAAKDSTNKFFVFRSFIPAPIEFDRGIHVTLEHGRGNTLRRDYASTVYWYQENAQKIFSRIVPAGARRNRTTSLLQPIIELENGQESFELPLEAETLPVEAAQGIYDPQDMLPYGPDWSGNQQMRFEAFQDGGEIAFGMPRLDYSGWYRLRARLTHAPDGAIVTIQVNDQVLIPKADLYSERVVLKTLDGKIPIFLHASDIPQVKLSVLGNREESEGFVVGVDTLQWLDSPVSPASLTVLGPFGKPGDPERTAPFTERTADGDRMLLGFMLPGSNRPGDKILSPAKNNADFDVGSLIASENMKEGLCFITWEIRVEQAGIYRFELAPAEVNPFLFREESGQMVPLRNRLLINDIILSGKDSFRYDPVERTVLPCRYRIPMQQGSNRISWLIDCNTKTRIRPVLYGISPEGK